MLYGVLLAGGLSSRMGEDKATLQLEGQTLLERAVELLREAGAEQVLVSGRPGHELGIPDLLSNCGPPGGLYSTLHWLREQVALEDCTLLLIPVDMPLLQAATLRRLVLEGLDDESCHYQGEVFPCLLQASEALYQHLKTLFAEAESSGGERSMKAVLRFLQAVAMEPAGIDGREFRNVNTPQQWAELSSD